VYVLSGDNKEHIGEYPSMIEGVIFVPSVFYVVILM